MTREDLMVAGMRFTPTCDRTFGLRGYAAKVLCAQLVTSMNPLSLEGATTLPTTFNLIWASTHPGHVDDRLHTSSNTTKSHFNGVAPRGIPGGCCFLEIQELARRLPQRGLQVLGH